MKTLASQQNALDVVPHGRRDANGSTPAFRVRGTIVGAAFLLDVTQGTGTLDAILEESTDGGSWSAAASFTQATEAGRSMITLTDPDSSKQYRISWTTSDEFTFRVKAVAVQ